MSVKSNKPDPYTMRPFSPATREYEDKINSQIRQGKSNQEIYDSVRGRHLPGTRKQVFLDYTRYLRDQHDIAEAIKQSPKQALDVLPMGITYQSSQFKYVVVGSAKPKKGDSFDFGITVNSSVALTQAQVFAQAEILAAANPEHYVNNYRGVDQEKQIDQRTLKGAKLNKLSIRGATSKNPLGLDRIVKQQDANMKYRTKQRKGKK